jgi:nitroimidazol reductase NimA-like FMN-containing flavoprotein (pyridoxamine 5'-phosphate oxidase superfamily)
LPTLRSAGHRRVGAMVTIGRDLCPWVNATRPAHTGFMTTTSDPSAVIHPSTDGQPGGVHVGDLARRVTHRRNELGLSTEELAHRAGVDSWFLSYFEQSSDTTLTGGALFRLAVALDTTPLALEGGLVDRPPGAGRAGLHPVLQDLSSTDCESHLAAGGIGRIVFSTETGPIALPVNFHFVGQQIVFRTSDDMALKIVGAVAFEVDHIDDAMSEGWSVLVRGHAQLIEDDAGRNEVARTGLDPWAGGARLSVIGITPSEVTGRVIVQRQSP